MYKSYSNNGTPCSQIAIGISLVLLEGGMPFGIVSRQREIYQETGCLSLPSTGFKPLAILSRETMDMTALKALHKQGGSLSLPSTGLNTPTIADEWG